MNQNNHMNFFKQRSIATRRIFKRLIINHHINIEKIIKNQILNLQNENSTDPSKNEFLITQNILLNKKLKMIKKRHTSKSKRKIDLLCDDYFDYFESQNLDDFGLAPFTNPEIESELDYLSENEICHEEENYEELLLPSLEALKAKMNKISEIVSNPKSESSSKKSKKN